MSASCSPLLDQSRVLTLHLHSPATAAIPAAGLQPRPHSPQHACSRVPLGPHYCLQPPRPHQGRPAMPTAVHPSWRCPDMRLCCTSDAAVRVPALQAIRIPSQRTGSLFLPTAAANQANRSSSSDSDSNSRRQPLSSMQVQQCTSYCYGIVPCSSLEHRTCCGVSYSAALARLERQPDSIRQPDVQHLVHNWPRQPRTGLVICCK
jgi:hypothetical protein